MYGSSALRSLAIPLCRKFRRWSRPRILHGNARCREDLGPILIWDESRGRPVCDGPPLLLAGHRPAPSCLPIFEVKDIDATAKELKRKGWQPESGKFEIPNGPCYLFKDPSGNQLAVFQDVRPGMFEQAHA